VLFCYSLQLYECLCEGVVIGQLSVSMLHNISLILADCVCNDTVGWVV